MIRYDILYVIHNDGECSDSKTIEHEISIRDVKTKKKKKSITVERYELSFVHFAKKTTQVTRNTLRACFTFFSFYFKNLTERKSRINRSLQDSPPPQLSAVPNNNNARSIDRAGRSPKAWIYQTRVSKTARNKPEEGKKKAARSVAFHRVVHRTKAITRGHWEREGRRRRR